jgi:cellobiose-specific phosphotransferase system component IIC
MFKNLFDLSYKRSGKEALGFYLAYLGMFALLGGLAATAVAVARITVGGQAPSGWSESFKAGIPAGAVTAIITSIYLAIAVVIQRKLARNVLYVVLAVVSVLFAAIMGGFLALMPIAFLTTREVKPKE